MVANAKCWMNTICCPPGVEKCPSNPSTFGTSRSTRKMTVIVNYVDCCSACCQKTDTREFVRRRALTPGCIPRYAKVELRRWFSRTDRCGLAVFGRRLHLQHGTSLLPSEVVIDRRNMRRGDRRFYRQSPFAKATGHKPRHAWDTRYETRQRGMRRDKARNLRVLRKEPRRGDCRRALRLLCCNFQEPARGVLQKPRASYFPSLGGGGSSPSRYSCSF